MDEIKCKCGGTHKKVWSQCSDCEGGDYIHKDIVDRDYVSKTKLGIQKQNERTNRAGVS